MGDTSIFDAYQEEFLKMADECRVRITTLQTCGANKEEKESTVAACNESIDKISNILKEMEMEVRTYTISNKRNCSEVLTKDKDEFTALKTEFNSAKFAAEKASLTGGKSGEDKRRMLDANER